MMLFYQCCGSALLSWFQSGSGSGTSGQWVLITKICCIQQLAKFLFFIYMYIKLLFIYLEDFMKDVQATEGAFSPQKRTSSTSKHKFFEFLHFFLFLCGHGQWGSGSSRPKSMRNHAVLDSDPDPQHWLFGCYSMWLDL